LVVCLLGYSHKICYTGYTPKEKKDASGDQARSLPGMKTHIMYAFAVGHHLWQTINS
jgi:hypothetical protein